MIEEKLKEVMDGLIPLCGTANIEPRIEDILSICKQEIDEACKKAKIEECEYWREIIFSPEQQAIKPTISLTDFQLRIVELSPKEK